MRRSCVFTLITSSALIMTGPVAAQDARLPANETAAPANSDFDVNATAALVDAAQPRELQSRDATPEEAARAMDDRIRTILSQQMRQCWEMPTDQPGPERLVVTVAFELNADGTLDGAPRVISPRNYLFDRPYRVAVENALRAVRQCAPYPFPNDEIVGQHFNAWKELELTFRAN